MAVPSLIRLAPAPSAGHRGRVMDLFPNLFAHRRQRRPVAVPLPDQLTVAGPAGAVVLHLRPSAQARRLTLRQDLASGEFRLTVPIGTGLPQIEAFVRQTGEWIEHHRQALPPRIPFAIGQSVPVLGTPHRIEASNGRRPVERFADPPRLLVAGQPTHHARRIGDYLKAEASRELTRRSHLTAAKLNCTITRVSLRDTKSRWGSCSAGGALSFSWRLILAPEPVLDYVVAHEVAHLIELNHSPRFWALVRSLSSDAVACRGWLRQHGAELLRYG